MFEYKIEFGCHRRFLRTLGKLSLLLLFSISLSSCVVRRPVMCFSISDVTSETVVSIKKMSASIASEHDLSIFDKSDKYPSRNIEHVNNSV